MIPNRSLCAQATASDKFALISKPQQLFQTRKLDLAEILCSLPKCLLSRARRGPSNHPLLKASQFKRRRVLIVCMLPEERLDTVR